MKTLVVNDKFNSKKLLAFLNYEFPSVSESIFYKALRKKDIRINDIKISENVTIYEDDEIKLYIADEFLTPNINLNIIYEDENILAVNKPKAVEVTGENSLTSIIQTKFDNNQILPCHRLDRNTTRNCYLCKGFCFFGYFA